MENITRRGFMGAAGALGIAASAGMLAAHASAEEAFAGVETSDWTGSSDAVAAVGNSTMPLSELNRRRKEYVDAQTAYTKEDGTIVPEVYVKMLALIHTYGYGGWGAAYVDTSFDELMRRFTEDQAQAFLDMPWGKQFTAYEYAAESGRPYDECVETCAFFAHEGFLYRKTTLDGTLYNQVAYVIGVAEYQMREVSACRDKDGGYNIGGMDRTAAVTDYLMSGTPVEITVPVSKDLVTDSQILPYDDVEAIMRTKNKFAVGPCLCRYNAIVAANEDCPSMEDFLTGKYEDYFSPLVNQRVETCLFFGHEAEYWIENGIGREITMDQALAYLQRSRDDGFVIQGMFMQETTAVCSCHGDSCGLLKQFRVLEPAQTATMPSFSQVSHYQLDVDLDACIQCGTCVDRCPMHSIEMGEDGYPVVNEICVRCGQCGYVCPVGARTLSARPAELNAELPLSMLDDHNMKAAYRFEHGLIG